MRISLVPALIGALSLSTLSPPVVASETPHSLVSLEQALQAPETLSARLRKDLPREIIPEINANLVAEKRLLWHASGSINSDTYPGLSADISQLTIANSLKMLADELAIPVQSQERLVWFHRQLDEEILQASVAALSNVDESEHKLAVDRLVKLDHPQAIRALLQLWAADTEKLPSSAGRAGIALALGAHRANLSQPRHLALTIWGNPSTAENRQHGLANLVNWQADTAPWVALTVTLANPEAQTAARNILNHHPALHKDVIALSLGICLGLAGGLETSNSVLQEALTVWCKNEHQLGNGIPRWETEFLGERARNMFHLLFPGETIPRPPVKKKKNQKVTVSTPKAPAQAIKEAVLKPQIAHRLLQSQNDIRTTEAALAEGKRTQADNLKELQRAYKIAQDRPKNINRELQRAVKLVTSLRDETASPELIKILIELISNRPDKVPNESVMHQDIRLAAVKVAENWRHPDLVGALKEATLNDPQPTVQVAAAISLGAQRTDDAVTALHEFQQHTGRVGLRLNAVRGLIRARPAEAGAWVISQFTNSSSDTERQTLLQLIGLLRDEQATDFLIETATSQDKQPNTRLAAAIGLRVIPTSKAQETLKSLLKNDPDVSIRQQILSGLTPTTLAESYQVMPLVLALLADEKNPEIRKILVEHAQLGSRLLPSGHPDRLAAGYALVRIIGDTNADGNLRRSAASGIKYTDVDAALVQELKEITTSTRHPILKRFFATSLKQAESRLE